MIGNLILIDNVWHIEYQQPLGPNVIQFKKVKLHPEDVKVCKDYGDYSVDWINKEVTFELVNEKDDEGFYIPYAKTISYEFEGTVVNAIKEYSENLSFTNSNKWDEIFSQYEKLNKEELIDQLKINYFCPNRKPV